MASETGKPRRTESSSGGIHFGDHATVGGDVFTGDKNVNTQNSSLDKETLLALLQQLQTVIQAAPLEQVDREKVDANVSAAINEVTNTEQPETEQPTTSSRLDSIKGYVEETKTILDRVKDIGEIGMSAMPIVLKIAGMIGLKFL